METIIKAKETMTAKERVKRTFAFEKTDRVTIGYDTNPSIHHRLCTALGVADDDYLTLYQKLGVDYAGAGPQYVGKQIYPEIPGRIRNAENGAVMRYIENEYGAYYDYCDFPLKDADSEMIANYPFPDPDDYDYDAEDRRIDRLTEMGFAIHLGSPGLADVLNTTGMLMGVEDALINLGIGDEATLEMTDRRLAVQLEVIERQLIKSKDKIDFIWIGEDLGTQHTPIISMEMYQRVLQPRHQKFIDLAKTYDLPIMIHTCGSSSWAYETFYQMGMTGVDTLQPEAANMSPSYLAEHFGGRLTFRGCISTAGPLAYGTAAETEQICRETLETLMPDGGYHFAPTHQIQDNTPVENVIAMYQAAHQYGCY